MRSSVARAILGVTLGLSLVASACLGEELVAQAQPAARQPQPGTPPGMPFARFVEMVDSARLAAERGDPETSLKAVTEALRSGPPARDVQLIRLADNRQRDLQRLGQEGGLRGMAPDADAFLQQTVLEKLVALVDQWDRSRVPPLEQYGALSAIVLPEGRPTEIFLYPRSFVVSELDRLSSVGRLLAGAAVRANRTEELRQRVFARQDDPVTKLSGQVLLALMAIERGEAGLGQARVALRAVQTHLESDADPRHAELACHAALAALRQEALANQVQSLLELVTDRLKAMPTRAEDLTGGVLKKVGRIQLQYGNTEGARASFRKCAQLLNDQQPGIGFGGPARKRMFSDLALEFARAGLLSDALDLLGQAADLPSNNRMEMAGDPALFWISQLLVRLPARERYDVLKAWTFPATPQKSVRLVAALVTRRHPPEVFRSQAGWARKPTGSAPERDPTPAAAPFSDGTTHPSPLVSTLDLLIDAARATNRLDELSKASREAAADNVPNAAIASLLVDLARKDFPAVLPELTERATGHRARVEGGGARRIAPIDFLEYLLARAGSQHAESRLVAEQYLRQLLDQSQQMLNPNWMSFLHYDIAASIARHNPAAAIEPEEDPHLALWHPGSHMILPSGRMQNTSTARMGPWWVVADGQVSHLAGPEMDELFFAYPLTGNFRFSYDSTFASWDETHVGFGGLIFEALHGGSDAAEVFPVGHHEAVMRAGPLEKNPSNKVTLTVRDNRLRVDVNGGRVYETENFAPTSPWLAIVTEGYRHTAFRNLTLSGDVRIPREVPLTFADRLEGWVSSTYNETLPPRLSIGENRGRPGVEANVQVLALAPQQRPVARDPTPDAYSWSADEGGIFGRRTSGAAPHTQSLLYYHRPLRSGETIRYEFLYEPGAVEVHPALDRLAFVLAPEGVRLHWSTDDVADVDYLTGLGPDNVADEPQNRRGPNPLPLKAGEWNAMSMSLADDVLSLTLNGSEVYRRRLEPTNDRQFGFFHYADRTAVKVRSVVLSGNWPERLPAEQMANLLAPAPGPVSDATLQARSALAGDWYVGLNWEEVLRKTRALPPAQRYVRLRDWVLPASEHVSIRPMGGYSQTNAPLAAGGPQAAGTAARRVNTGGELTAPVFDLLAMARELGKVDEVHSRALAFEPEEDYDRRCKACLLVLTSIALKDDAAAAGYLRQLQAMLGIPVGRVYTHTRWPELAAASQAATVPALRPLALDILDELVRQTRGFEAGSNWDELLIPVRDRARVLALGNTSAEALGADPPLKQWARVTNGTARSNGFGFPQPHWWVSGGEVRHYAGHEDDALYFKVPLRGDFEIACQLGAFGSDTAQIGYGGMSLGNSGVPDGLPTPKPNVGEIGGRAPPAAGAQPVAGGEWSDYRFTVRDGTLTVYVGGRKIQEQPLTAEADPWLAIRCAPQVFGGCRNLKITGQPVIPEQLDLLQAAPNAWRAYFSDDKVGTEPTNWRLAEGELVKAIRPELAGTWRQSLVRYHRPLLEDGSIGYEFLYEPGKTRVDPAIDRVAFGLEPEGVRIHWVNDAQFDRSELGPENVTDEPARRRGPAKLPLKENEWNKVVLTVKGDVVTLALNGELVYERPLEPTNQRTFGLFHYADQTEVRVRSLTYRGDWAKTLPGLAEQELAR